MAPVIRPNACRSCKFKEIVGVDPSGVPAMECRRYPPIGGPILVPVQPGMASIQIHTAFPKVLPDFWCGEHKPQIEASAKDIDTTNVISFAQKQRELMDSTKRFAA